MRAIQIREFGGPEVLELVDLPDPEPVEGTVLVDVSRAGVNYADTHSAENSYLAKQSLPFIPGGEVVGTTSQGRRVVALVQGGYAERCLAAPALAFDVPPELDDGAALALVIQGVSAWHLLRTSVRLQPGESVVVHAAAGGVGTLAVQLAKAWGAGRVIGTASSEEKRALVTDLGADAVVDSTASDLKAALLDANDGEKLDVVLEMVGGPTFDQSLSALAPFGRLVTFGMAGRTPPKPIEAGALMAHSSGVIGFWMVHCLRRPEMLSTALTDLVEMTLLGSLRPIVGATYPLSEARRAHEDLRARRTTGKVVLDPSA